MATLDTGDYELQRVLPNELIDLLVQPYTGIAHQPDIVTLTGLPEDIIINEIFPLIEDDVELVYAQMNMLRPGTVPNRQVWLRIMRDRLPDLYHEFTNIYSMFLHRFADNTAFLKTLRVVGRKYGYHPYTNVELMFLLMVGLYHIPEFTSYDSLESEHWIIYFTLFGGDLQDVADQDPSTIGSTEYMFLARHGVTLYRSAIEIVPFVDDMKYANALAQADIMLSLDDLRKIREIENLPPVITAKVIKYITEYQPVNEYERNELKEVKVLWGLVDVSPIRIASPRTSPRRYPIPVKIAPTLFPRAYLESSGSTLSEEEEEEKESLEEFQAGSRVMRDPPSRRSSILSNDGEISPLESPDINRLTPITESDEEDSLR